MQTDTGQTKIQHALQTAERVFFDSVKEEYENVLPNAVITVYARKMEFHEKGGRSDLMFEITDDTLTEEELDHQLYSRQESLSQRFLDRAATYPDSKRNPEVNNRMRFLGVVLYFEGDFPVWDEFTRRSQVDKSDFYEIGKIRIRENKQFWDYFWDTIQTVCTVYTLLTFVGVDVDIPEIINLIENTDISELTDRISELIEQIKDKIKESDIPEKLRDLFQKNVHLDREVGSNGTDATSDGV